MLEEDVPVYQPTKEEVTSDVRMQLAPSIYELFFTSLGHVVEQNNSSVTNLLNLEIFAAFGCLST